jgi:hypothetical protein
MFNNDKFHKATLKYYDKMFKELKSLKIRKEKPLITWNQ